MKIFKTNAPEGFELALLVNSNDWDTLRFDGRSRQDSWVPVKMRSLLTDEFGQRRLESDFPGCAGGHMLLVRQSGVDALGDLLRASGELLPLENVGGGRLWTFNVTTLLDCLDERKSSLLRMPETGKIIRVKQPVFRLAAIAEHCAPLFKVVQMPYGIIYCTEVFMERVTSLALRGLEFRQVWASD